MHLSCDSCVCVCVYARACEHEDSGLHDDDDNGLRAGRSAVQRATTRSGVRATASAAAAVSPAAAHVTRVRARARANVLPYRYSQAFSAIHLFAYQHTPLLSPLHTSTLSDRGCRSCQPRKRKKLHYFSKRQARRF